MKFDSISQIKQLQYNNTIYMYIISRRKATLESKIHEAEHFVYIINIKIARVKMHV